MPDLYDELRRIAAQTMRRERRHHTLRPTALANETYIRLAKESRREWQSKAQVLTAAAHVMRRILVDHARRRSAGKRGGRSKPVSYDELRAAAGSGATLSGPRENGVDPDLVALDEALERLASFDPKAAQVVELRHFAGLTVAETASILDVSPATVKREWALARAWLYRELSR